MVVLNLLHSFLHPYVLTTPHFIEKIKALQPGFSKLFTPVLQNFLINFPSFCLIQTILVSIISPVQNLTHLSSSSAFPLYPVSLPIVQLVATLLSSSGKVALYLFFVLCSHACYALASGRNCFIIEGLLVHVKEKTNLLLND